MDAVPSLATRVYKLDIEIVPYLTLQALEITALLETKETPPHVNMQTAQVSVKQTENKLEYRLFFNVDVNFVTKPNKLDNGNLKTTMKSSKC